MNREILLERCRNCERGINERGKLCAWRSLSNDYCWDDMSEEEAHKEIKRQIDDVQTKIARGQL